MRIELAFDDFVLDLYRLVLYKGKVRVNARRMELHMLIYLIQAAPHPVPAKELYESASGLRYERDDVENMGNSFKVQMSRLRQSMRPANLIETIKGEGYRFNGEATFVAADLPHGSRVERGGQTVYRF